MNRSHYRRKQIGGGHEAGTHAKRWIGNKKHGSERLEADGSRQGEKIRRGNKEKGIGHETVLSITY
jgi:hypothetical protein